MLLISGSYESLLDYAMFAIWLSYGFMVAGVIVLRIKRPSLDRPYRMWGYPVTPILFLLITAWFLGNMIVTRPVPSLAGLGLILTGVPIYFFWARQLHGGPHLRDRPEPSGQFLRLEALLPATLVRSDGTGNS